VSETYEEFGRIDGIVNYAGFLRDSMVFNMSDEDWESVTEVHLRGHFNILRELGDHWRQRSTEGELDRQRSIVTISSEAAMGTPGQVNYSAGKAGILGMTRTAARELFEYDVRVNAVMPAGKTRLVETMPDEMVEAVPESLTPDRVAILPAALLGDETEDLTGWTFGVGGNTVYTVTDPVFDRSATMREGWDPAGMAQVMDNLIAERPSEKTHRTGMFFVG
jgi:NAD(P)-dependent dehydrogenase (short-subunit alcohol dehydrogenase family)